MLFDSIYVFICWAICTWYLPKINLVKSLGFKENQIRVLFSVKVLVGIGFMLFYQYYYDDRQNTDAFRFYDDGNILYNVFHSDPLTFFKILFGIEMQSAEVIASVDLMNNWYKEHLHGVFNDNMTIIRFNALVRFLSFDVYHIHTLAVNFLGFLGLAAMVNGVKNLGVNTRLTFLSILLFPGILFWSSGVLKESLLLFVMGYLILFSFRLAQQCNLKNGFGWLIFLLLGLTVKSYVAASIVIGFGLLMVAQKARLKATTLIVSYVSVISVIGFSLNRLLDLRIPFRIFQKQHDFINEVVANKPGSAFEIFVLEPNWWSLIQHAPHAFFNSLVRPFFWEVNSIVSLVASMEILLLITLIGISIFFRKKRNNQAVISISGLLISATVILVIVGWVTPVFGALVRYKIPALLLIILALNLIIDFKKNPFLNRWR